MPESPPPLQNYTIAVVGDIHDQWSRADEQALLALEVDLVLFVGDFGNESLPVARRIAQLSIPKAIALGNHDAWYTATPWGQKRCPYDEQTDNWFQQQWDLLQDFHVGYGFIDFPHLQLSIVGGRPFSWGGPKWFIAEFYEMWFGVTSEADSRDRIFNAIQSATYDSVIILSHNGPYGLGEQPEDICGKDWRPIGGDHGDRDLTAAIAGDHGKSISLVTFGHMHHNLRHRQDRIRERLQHKSQGPIYLNAAAVPRVRASNNGTLHQFSLIQFEANILQQISAVWVTPQGEIMTQETLFKHQKQPQEPSRVT